jgi:hypothetical protein
MKNPIYKLSNNSPNKKAIPILKISVKKKNTNTTMSLEINEGTMIAVVFNNLNLISS